MICQSMKQTLIDKPICLHYYVASKPLIAVSACLTGQKVQHNGEAAELQTLPKGWSKHLELLSICPEIEIGMKVPRPATRLVKENGKLRLVTQQNSVDYTDRMLEYSQIQSDYLASAGVCGFIFKNDSATCGLEKVGVHNADFSELSNNGRGLFATVFTTFNPHIPTIEGEKLIDEEQSEHFLARVHFFHEWQSLGKSGWNAKKIMTFHNESKLFLLSRAPQMKRILGRMIATRLDEGAHPEIIALEYMTKAQKALSLTTKKGRIAHTMERVFGKISNQLSKQERQELIELIHGFRQGFVPKSAPMLLLNKYLGKYNLNDKNINRFINPVPHGMDLLRRV